MIRILLVDDDAYNHESVQLYLKREGMEILEAGAKAAVPAKLKQKLTG